MSIELSLLLIIIASVLSFICGAAYQAWALDRVIKDFRARLKKIAAAEKVYYDDRRRKRFWEHLAPARPERVEPLAEVSGSPSPPGTGSL